MARELKSALNSIKLSERGVFVQASTLGSLEALLEFLKGSKIPVSEKRLLGKRERKDFQGILGNGKLRESLWRKFSGIIIV